MAQTEMGDRLILLETFIRIVEAGSLSAAAIHLNTTQATVSRRLKSLEKLVGATLLIRNTHSLKMTDEGIAVCEQAKELLRRWDNLADTMQIAQGKPAGLLRVRVPHAFGQVQLLNIICRFLKMYPDVSIEWSLSDDVPDFFKDPIDCAIYVGHKLDPNHIALLVAEVPRIIIASPDIFMTDIRPDISDVGKHPWVSLNTFYKYYINLKNINSGEIIKRDIQSRFLTDNLFTLKEAVLQGIGLGVVSTWMVTEEIKQKKLIHILPDFEGEPLPLYIIYPYSTYYPERMRKFITVMKQELPLIEGVRSI